MFEPYEEEREAARKETERLDEMIRRVYAEKTRAVGEDKRIELLDHLIYTAERIKDETWVVLLVGIRREI